MLLMVYLEGDYESGSAGFGCRGCAPGALAERFKTRPSASRFLSLPWDAPETAPYGVAATSAMATISARGSSRGRVECAGQLAEPGPAPALRDAS